MKHSILLLCLLFFGSSYADGLDEVTVFVNRKKIMTITERDGIELKLDSLKVGDTLEFRVWTDWSQLFASTISLETEGLAVRQLQQYPKNERRAYFRFVVDDEFLKRKTSFIFHYNEGPVPSWPFAFTNKYK